MNTTVNLWNCSNLLHPTAQKIGESFAFFLFFVVSLVGNTSIALIVYKTQSMRTPINYFIANMAISDLMFPLLLVPREITWLYTAGSWLNSGPLGKTMCKVIPFLTNASMLVSIQSLVLIAVDRLGGVLFPLRSPLISSKLCPFVIFITWIVAIAVKSPFLFSVKVVEYPRGQQACRWRWVEVFGDSSSEDNYFLVVYITLIYTPLVLLIIVYSILLIKLWSEKIPGDQSISTNAHSRRAKRNRDVSKMAVATVLTFVLCWVPYSIVDSLLYFASGYDNNCSMVLILHIALFMAFSNCAVNPIICFIFCSKYRQGFKRIFHCFD